MTNWKREGRAPDRQEISRDTREIETVVSSEIDDTRMIKVSAATIIDMVIFQPENASRLVLLRIHNPKIQKKPACLPSQAVPVINNISRRLFIYDKSNIINFIIDSGAEISVDIVLHRNSTRTLKLRPN